VYQIIMKIITKLSIYLTVSSLYFIRIIFINHYWSW